MGTYCSYVREQLFIIEYSLRFLTSPLKLGGYNIWAHCPLNAAKIYLNRKKYECKIAQPRYLPTWLPGWEPNSFAFMIASSWIDRGKICRILVAKRMLRRAAAAKPRHLPTWRQVWGLTSFALMVVSSRIDRGKICRGAVAKRLLRRVAYIILCYII